MLKAEINRQTETGVITASGSAAELLSDIAILVNSIYRQLQGAAPETAALFRIGLARMAEDENSPMWDNGGGGQIGFAIKKS